MKRLSKIKFNFLLFKNFILKLYYGIFYGIHFDDSQTRGTLLPNTGDNDFVSIKQKGKFIDIEQKQTGRVIRMIPSRHSNGYMVEFHEEGEIIYRGQMSFNEIWKKYIKE